LLKRDTFNIWVIFINIIVLILILIKRNITFVIVLKII
jgi:hypothetical protein